MRVEPFNYPIDDRLIQKVDLMVARCVQKNPKRDAVLIVEGAEGEGKTTMSIGIAYYVSKVTGRKFGAENIYFDVQDMIKFLQSTEEQIVIWDEPALQAMAKDHQSPVVKDLERLLMMARKKRHFIIFNIAYFNKFSDYIVWQRPLGMIHVYSRDEVQAGRFVYIRKKNLETLMRIWRSKKQRAYKMLYSFMGTFPDILNSDYKNNVLSAFDNALYESNKDKAILKIGTTTKGDKSNVYKDKYHKLIAKIATIPEFNKETIANHLGINRATVFRWAKADTPQIITVANSHDYTILREDGTQSDQDG